MFKKVFPCTTLAACLVIAVPSTSNAATAAELLEKGIYTEETVGDLDAAIRVYRSVVDAAKEASQAAAEAQYRIGVCLQKQGKNDEAVKAFQTVVEQFPSAKDWVAKAQSQLPADLELLPAPWGDGDELQLEMKLQTGLGIGLQVYRVTKSTLDGKPVWQCSTWQAVTLNNQLGKSTVIADLETFAPFQSTWKHSLLGKATADYGIKKVTVQLADKDAPTELNFDGRVYDNEQCAELFRRLPLSVGFKTKLDVISSLGAAKIDLGIECDAEETIETSAGKFECFRLKLDIGQVFWISSDENRYIVRFNAGPVTASLVKAGKPKPNENSEVKNERFSLTLPPDWFAYTGDKPNDVSPTTTLIDPKAIVGVAIEAGPLDRLTSKHKTARDWMKDSLENYRGQLADFQLNESAIRSIKVNRQDAVIADFTFTEGEKAMKARRITMYGNSSAINIRMAVETDQFAEIEPVVDRILSTLTLK